MLSLDIALAYTHHLAGGRHACNETEEALKNSFNGADAVGPSLSFLPFSDHHA